MQKTFDELITFLLISTLLILMMGGFVVLILFLYRKRQLAHLKEFEQIKSEYEKNLLRTQLEIQEQTFQMISQEIHDNINLSLTLAKLNLNTINLFERYKSTEQIKSSISLVSKAIEDLSDISRSLNSNIIIEQGLITALTDELNKLRRLKKYKINFEITGSPIYMDAQKELFIFRIIQEAFNNFLKHSYANNLWLLLNYTSNNLNISIIDDGVGFETQNKLDKNPPTAGIKNMQKRAELLNGIFQIKSNCGEGTNIEIKIPVYT